MQLKFEQLIIQYCCLKDYSYKRYYECNALPIAWKETMNSSTKELFNEFDNCFTQNNVDIIQIDLMPFISQLRLQRRRHLLGGKYLVLYHHYGLWHIKKSKVNTLYILLLLAAVWDIYGAIRKWTMPWCLKKIKINLLNIVDDDNKQQEEMNIDNNNCNNNQLKKIKMEIDDKDNDNKEKDAINFNNNNHNNAQLNQMNVDDNNNDNHLSQYEVIKTYKEEVFKKLFDNGYNCNYITLIFNIYENNYYDPNKVYCIDLNMLNHINKIIEQQYKEQQYLEMFSRKYKIKLSTNQRIQLAFDNSKFKAYEFVQKLIDDENRNDIIDSLNSYGNRKKIFAVAMILGKYVKKNGDYATNALIPKIKSALQQIVQNNNR